MSSVVGLKLLVIFGTLFLLMFLRFPVFMALALSCVSYMIFFPGEVPIEIVGQGFVSGLKSLSFAAFGFYFILGGVINRTSLGDRLVDFCNSLIGHIPGALSHINILVSMVFAGVSGSATADSASVGAMMIPMMKKQGYPAGYAAAVTEVSSMIGPIIPPSGAFILFGIYFNTSIRKMFIAGIIPGVLLGVAQLLVSGIISKKRNFPRVKWQGWKNVWTQTKRGLPAFLLPALVMFCLLEGIGTVIEIGAVSAALAVLLAVCYREMSFRKLMDVLLESAKGMASVLCIVAVSGLFIWILASMGITKYILNTLTLFGNDPMQVTAFCMIAFFFLGMILDIAVLQMVIMPVIASSILSLGIDPTWFCVIATLVIQMGLCTPPVGNLIYLDSKIADCPPLETAKESLPFLAIMVLFVVLLIIFPQMTLWLPSVVM